MQEIGPLFVCMMLTDKHALYTGTSVADNTRKARVTGVSVADKSCIAVRCVQDGCSPMMGLNILWKGVNGPMQFGWLK
jgi:hypothetical protein